MTGAEGVIDLHQALPPQSLTGAYALELVAGETVIGQYRFQVEEFVPDRISVNVAPEEASAGPGANLPFAVTGRYLFGAPAGNLPVEARVRLVKAPFAPKGFEAYTFGDPERSFEDQEILQETGNLDEAGQAAFEASLPEGLSPPAPGSHLHRPGARRRRTRRHGARPPAGPRLSGLSGLKAPQERSRAPRTAHDLRVRDRSIQPASRSTRPS